MSLWKRQALEGLADAFTKGARHRVAREYESKLKDLHAKIGELTVERDFFSARVGSLSRKRRLGIVERDGALSLSRQCALLGVSRSSQYYRPKGEAAEDLALMKRLDALHTAYPFYGSRQMMRHLRRDGIAAGRHRIRRLMRRMGMEAVYRRPRTSTASPEHRVYPYLLGGLTIVRADQCMVCGHLDSAQ